MTTSKQNTRVIGSRSTSDRASRWLIASVAALLASGPFAASAALVEGLCDGTVDENVTCDTETGLEWLDLTETVGLSINDFLADASFNGWHVATGALVDELLINAGFTLEGGSAAQGPSARLMLALFGITSDQLSNADAGAGRAINGTDIASAPYYFISYEGPSDPDVGWAVGSNSSCCTDFDASSEGIGVWAYRVRSVMIDIKPGKEPNSINPTSGQKIPVAILTTDTFLAFNEVVALSVSFGPDGATEVHRAGHVKDVDDDGDMDVLFHFDTSETGIACGDTEATLTGMTIGGQAITGTDAIRTVKCPPVVITTITELVGDKDCFGFGAPCSDGVSVVDPRFGPDGDALVEPSDPLGTDQLGTSVPLGGPSFDFQFDIASFDVIGVTPTSASVTIFTGGIDLGDGPQFLFNGTSIGSYVEAAGQENIAATVVFDVPTYLLTNLNNLTLSFVDQGFIQDGFVIDYVELTVVGSNAASVP